METNGTAGGRDSRGGEEVAEHFQGDREPFCGASEGGGESSEAASDEGRRCLHGIVDITESEHDVVGGWDSAGMLDHGWRLWVCVASYLCSVCGWNSDMVAVCLVWGGGFCTSKRI